jgi:4-hydroxybenzoyl-CoA thioesterase
MAFTATRRVDFPMLDKAGIMYYPNYWDMAHRFFEESWLDICGVCYPDILDEWKLGFPAVSNECKFLAPLRYGENIYCTLWVSSVGNSSITWEYSFSNGEAEVWRATVVTVCVDMGTLQPEPLPDSLKEGLLACAETEV